MSEAVSLQRSLIEVDDSILVVIDVQKSFLAKLPASESEGLVQRIGWLIGVATKLGVPLLVTAEDIPGLGSVAPQIARALPADIPIYNKMIFGLTSDPEILTAVERTDRKTAILVGLETDVCVAQSAIGLLQQGYQVVAVADATASPETGHQLGLERMRRAGVLISTVKALFYEWLRTVERSNEFVREYGAELGDSGVVM